MAKDIDIIKTNISNGTWNTALEKWGNMGVQPFPSTSFCGFCHIRSFEPNGVPKIEYKLKIVWNKPVELFGPVDGKVKKSELSDLWSFISGLEIKKRQR